VKIRKGVFSLNNNNKKDLPFLGGGAFWGHESGKGCHFGAGKNVTRKRHDDFQGRKGSVFPYPGGKRGTSDLSCESICATPKEGDWKLGGRGGSWAYGKKINILNDREFVANPCRR